MYRNGASDLWQQVTPVILAGGLGTRLRSVIADRSKVLAPVQERPFLTFLLDQLAAASFNSVVLLTGYRAEQVRQTLGETYKGLRLTYSVETQPMGTAGALLLAAPHLTGRTILLMNGDSYCDVDFAALLAFHQWHQADMTMTLVEVARVERFGHVEVFGNGRVQRFAEKPTAHGSGWINAGISLLERNLVADIPVERPVSLERDLLPGWVAGKKVFGFRWSGAFLDIGTPESYAAANAFFAAKEHRMSLNWTQTKTV